MDDRKYRQRGYQDSGRDRPDRRSDRSVNGRTEQRGPRPETFGPRTPRFPGAHYVVRCSSCGTILPADFDPGGRCPRCGFELHSCKQCVYFDTAARFECAQPVPERITPKDVANHCKFYAPRTTVERQTSPETQSAAPVSPRSNDPRQAFENLFKK